MHFSCPLYRGCPYLRGSSIGVSTVHLTLSNLMTFSSCTDSNDYANGTYPYTFEAGQTRVCQRIGIIDDGKLESVEEFEVTLSAEDEPTAVVIPNRAIVKITDNDGMCVEVLISKTVSTNRKL